MSSANIDALYAGSIRLKIAYFSSSNFTFYKWRITKVAHCMVLMLLRVVQTLINPYINCSERQLLLFCKGGNSILLLFLLLILLILYIPVNK